MTLFFLLKNVLENKIKYYKKSIKKTIIHHKCGKNRKIDKSFTQFLVDKKWKLISILISLIVV